MTTDKPSSGSHLRRLTRERHRAFEAQRESDPERWGTVDNPLPMLVPSIDPPTGDGVRVGLD